MGFSFPARRRLFLLLALLFALVALFPLRLAFNMLGLQENGLAARSINGGVWWGTIEQLRLGRVMLGNVEARLSPIQLLVGRARMDFVRQTGGPDDLKGAVTVSSASFGIDDVTASIGADGLFAPLPISGIDFSDVSVRFADGACVRAQGRIKARMAATIQGLNLSQGLSGEAVCDGPALFLPLVSQSGLEKLNLHIEADGSYRAELLVSTMDAALAGTLAGNGFSRAADGGYVLKISGRL
ncbi:MAG: type II secretion system protein N [Alphaproteobacteria bacterium]|nr:type II secretion system protein N [Alphaproteobacteria bacterium]